MNITNKINKITKVAHFPLFFGLLLLLGSFFAQAMEEGGNKRKFEEIEKSEEDVNELNKRKKLSKEEAVEEAMKYAKSIREAIETGDEEKIKKFTKKNDNNTRNSLNDFIINSMKSAKNASFLHFALEKNQFKIALLLIHSDNITLDTLNAQDVNGATALMIAINKNQPAIAQLLIEKGVDLNLQESDGFSALMIAAAKDQQQEIARLLVEKGADLNLKTNKDVTVLMIAIGKNQPEIAQLLIEKGANLDLETIAGSYTALTFAIDRFFRDNSNKYLLDVVKMLLYHNATFSDQEYLWARREKELQELFDEIRAYTFNASSEDEKYALVRQAALYFAIKPINKKSNFNKKEWLTLAILRNDDEQIQYCIDKKVFTKQEVENLKLYLKLRSKTSKQLLDLVDKRACTAFKILTALAIQPPEIMPLNLDAAGPLLETTNDDQRKNLMKLAERNKNKEFGRKIVAFNKSVKGFTTIDSTKKAKIPYSKPLSSDEIKKISSYL